MNKLEPIFDKLSHFSVGITEFIGTYFLIVTIGICSIYKVSSAPLAIGSSLMVCVFMGGHISGAHYNPAVSTAVYLSGRNKLSTKTWLVYICTQLFAGFCAGLTYWSLTDKTFAPFPQNNTTQRQAFSVEVLYTFLLASVVLNTATTKSNTDNSFYGLAIGFTVVVGAAVCGQISGGVFNPAVGFGTIMVNSIDQGASNFDHLWIYICGPIVGAIIAVIVFRITNHQTEYLRIDDAHEDLLTKSDSSVNKAEIS